MTGTSLDITPILETTWNDWKQAHPDTLVLSFDTGHRRDYETDPYRISAERMLGVIIGKQAKAYPFTELAKAGSFPIRDRVEKQTLLIYFDEKNQAAWATDESGKRVQSFTSYTSAWRDFHPKSKTFKFKE